MRSLIVPIGLAFRRIKSVVCTSLPEKVVYVICNQHWIDVNLP